MYDANRIAALGIVLTLEIVGLGIGLLTGQV